MKNPSFWEDIRFHIDECNLNVRSDQIRSRLNFFPIMVGSQMIIEPLLVGLLWGQVAHANLIIWLAVLIVIHAVEMGAWWKQRMLVETIAQCRTWSVRFVVFAGAVGAMWGGAALCFFPPDLAYQALFICVIVGLTSGAVTMNPIHPPALHMFILSILLPTIMRVAYEGDSVHSILALMLILFMVVILNSGRQLGGIFFKSLVQRYENLALVEMLTKEKARAENASREKSRFLATASHDLRQPLQALMLFSDAMQNMVREKEAKHLAGQIGKSVNALVEMFDELLDVSKLEAGIVDVRWKTFELQPLLDRLFMDFAPLAHSKGLNFKLPACDAIEHDEQVACNVVVYSDPFLLERILRNLVSNAIRYTDSGSVELRCVCVDDKVSLKVVDTGIGIHAEAIPHIFEEYYQADNQHRDRRKGLGLGLAIVHRMENLLGYEISVKSELGVGSEFGFMLQKGKTEQQLAQPFIMSRDRHDVSGTVVVLVEDDPDIRQLIAGLMLDWGCTVFDAENADEAMRKVEIAQQSPELLVCDYRLPQGVTAIHVVKRMRELWGEDMPALVLTGDTAPQALQDIRASGAVLLHKPIAPERLRSMMYFALHRES